MTTIRLLSPADVPALVDLVVRNRDFMRPWDPTREDPYFTEEGQAADVDRALAAHRNGTTIPFAILLDNVLVGRTTINNVVRGPFQTASVGYWVDQQANGRGVASAAVAAVIRHAFDEAGLHRLEAGTLLHNHGSQRVLAKNGFVQFGMAPRYLRIDGEWRDHVLFQLLNEP